METDVQIKSDLTAPCPMDEIDMRSINGNVQQNRDEQLGELVAIPEVEATKLPNYYYAPKEGLNFLRIKNPDRCYSTRGKYKGNNNVTHYYIFDGFLDRADKRIVTVPQELKLQFSEKVVFSSYSYQLNKLKKISPYIGSMAHVVMYLVNKRLCIVHFFREERYFRLLEMTNKEILTTCFPQLRILKTVNKPKKTSESCNNEFSG